jgi:putative PIN family toxin of toxin-antitoxin system
VRAVLDVNVLISALLSPGGGPATLVLRWLAGDYELVVSDQLLAELERALAYPKVLSRIPAKDARRFVDGLRRSAHVIADVEDPPRRSSDPGDDYLLALAETASAVLVSGDRHVLDLGGRLPVQSAHEFLRSLDEEASRG